MPITFSTTTSPPGVDVPGAQWVKIRGAGGVASNEQLVAVQRPAGQGPFPLVILLHGSDFGDLLVKWATGLAAAGFVVVAGCWQALAIDPTTRAVYDLTMTRIGCPHMVAKETDAITALIALGLKQPGIREDAVALFGISAGGGAALRATAVRHDIQAVAVDSAAVQEAPQASRINVPVLLLAGMEDFNVPFTIQADYVKALGQAGKDVESHFYGGAGHGLIYNPATKEDATHRIIDFLGRRLKAGT